MKYMLVLFCPWVSAGICIASISDGVFAFNSSVYEIYPSCLCARESWSGQPWIPWRILQVLGTRRILWPCVPISFCDFLVLRRRSGSGLYPVIPILLQGRWGTSLLSWFRNGLLCYLMTVIAPASLLQFTDCPFLLLSKESRPWTILAGLPILLCPWQWRRCMVLWYS